MTDGTEVIYYTDLDGMLDYVEKTIGKWKMGNKIAVYIRKNIVLL